jgi:hypothetical protein
MMHKHSAVHLGFVFTVITLVAMLFGMSGYIVSFWFGAANFWFGLAWLVHMLEEK